MRQWRAAVMLLVFVPTYTQAQQRKPVCKVAVDIGHTEESQGATSARGVGEYVFNRNFAQVLVEKLARQRWLEAFVLDQTNKNLQERVTAANLRDADLLVSIHHDSVQPQYLSTWVHSGAEHKYSDRFSGYSLFVSRRIHSSTRVLDSQETSAPIFLKRGSVDLCTMRKKSRREQDSHRS